MASIQISGLDPVNMHNLDDLVDGTFDELQGHRFHNQKFNIGLLDLANFSNSVEWKTSLVLTTLEDHLQKGNNSYFLLQVSHFRNNVLKFTNKFLVGLNSSVEFSDIAFTESFHHVIKPFKIGSDQNVDDIVVQQLSDIKNFFSKQNGHAHFDTELFFLLVRNFIFWSIDQVLELTFIVVFVIIFSLIVKSVNLG